MNKQITRIISLRNSTFKDNQINKSSLLANFKYMFDVRTHKARFGQIYEINLRAIDIRRKRCFNATKDTNYLDS